MTDDDKEKKAARLEAEAQAEAGRGGRWSGRGGGGPVEQARVDKDVVYRVVVADREVWRREVEDR